MKILFAKTHFMHVFPFQPTTSHTVTNVAVEFLITFCCFNFHQVWFQPKKTFFQQLQDCQKLAWFSFHLQISCRQQFQVYWSFSENQKSTVHLLKNNIKHFHLKLISQTQHNYKKTQQIENRFVFQIQEESTSVNQTCACAVNLFSSTQLAVRMYS